MVRVVLTLAVILVGALEGAPSSAQMGIPNARACTARHWVTGAPVPVRQRPGFSPFWAHASWDPDGWPAITYGSAYFGLDPLLQLFTTTHECGHLVLQSTNEFAANCFALEQLRLSEGEIRIIAQVHRSFPVLGPQYGGSGANFWALTEQYCPDLAN